MSKLGISKGQRWIYSLFENGEKVFEGFDTEMLDFVLAKDGKAIKVNCLGVYVRKGHRVLGKYDVTRVIGTDRSKHNTKKCKKEKVSSDTYDYVIRHLKEYGNVCLNKRHNIESIVEELETNNIKVRSRYATDNYDGKDGFYILEKC